MSESSSSELRTDEVDEVKFLPLTRCHGRSVRTRPNSYADSHTARTSTTSHSRPSLVSGAAPYLVPVFLLPLPLDLVVPAVFHTAAEPSDLRTPARSLDAARLDVVSLHPDLEDRLEPRDVREGAIPERGDQACVRQALDAVFRLLADRLRPLLGQVPLPFLRLIIESLVSAGSAEYDPKPTKNKPATGAWIYWKRPEEWAQVLYEWVRRAPRFQLCFTYWKAT